MSSLKASAQKTTAAWVTFIDDIRCLEASTTSKSAWLKSLHLGCLNKSVGEKLKVYSHLRALTSKVHIAFPSEQSQGRRFALHTDDSQVEIDDQLREQKELESEQQALSLVILEDHSRPPEATEEVSPLLFTSTAFFNFLHSDDWGGSISLRVINGEVRHLLLAALCDLEMLFLVDSNTVYANLNNGLSFQVDFQKQNVAQETASGIQEDFRKTFKPSNELVYEKMSVEIVFYAKTEVSNIPHVIHEHENGDNHAQMSMQRDVTRYPYALHYHEIDYVRLPASEDVDTKSTILKLEAELNELKAAELPPKDIPATGRLPEKENAASDKVEWIADDPYLMPENSEKLYTGGTVTAKESPSTRKSSQAVPEHVPSKVLNEEEMILDEILSHLSDKFSIQDIEDEEEHVGVQSADSSVGSYVIISSPTQFAKPDKEEPTLKRLNLTRNELYIAGLYNPNRENAVCVEKTLQITRLKRFEQRLAKEIGIYEKLQEKLPFDITERFKCLAAAKLYASKRSLGPQSLKKAKLAHLSQPSSISLWEKYSKDQQNMEMNSALNNDVERDVLSRMHAIKKQKMETEPEVRTKGMKNKSKNNLEERNVSVKRSKEGILRSANQKQTKNWNTNANTKIKKQYKTSWQHTLPSINNNTENPTRLSKRGSKSLVTLPPIFQNESQNKLRRTIIDKNRCKSEKEIFSDLRTHELVNRTSGRDTKNKKYGIIRPLKLETICEKISTEKDIVYNLNTPSAMLSSPQRQGNSNFNRNQNNLTKDGEEDEEHADSTDEDEEEHEGSQEASVNETLVDNDENEIKYVDSYNEKLQQYQCQCSCEECVCLTETLSRGAGDPPDTVYPIILGRLRRDFKFLKCANYEPKGVSISTDPYFELDELTHEFVCGSLLKLMENVLIRKEILTSSLGCTYVTITFTKLDANRK